MRRALIVAIVVMMVMASTASAQRGRREVSPDPTPTPTPDYSLPPSAKDIQVTGAVLFVMSLGYDNVGEDCETSYVLKNGYELVVQYPDEDGKLWATKQDLTHGVIVNTGDAGYSESTACMSVFQLDLPAASEYSFHLDSETLFSVEYEELSTYGHDILIPTNKPSETNIVNRGVADVSLDVFGVRYLMGNQDPLTPTPDPTEPVRVVSLNGDWGASHNFKIEEAGLYQVTVVAPNARSYIDIAVIRNLDTGQEYPEFYWTIFGPQTYSIPLWLEPGTYLFDCRAAGGWFFHIDTIPAQ